MYKPKNQDMVQKFFIFIRCLPTDDTQAWEVTAEQYKLKWRCKTEELNLLEAPRKPSWQFKAFLNHKEFAGANGAPRTESPD